jgi:hypothetical protein
MAAIKQRRHAGRAQHRVIGAVSKDRLGGLAFRAADGRGGDGDHGLAHIAAARGPALAKKARVVSFNISGKSKARNFTSASDNSYIALSGMGIEEWPPGLVASIR